MDALVMVGVLLLLALWILLIFAAVDEGNRNGKNGKNGKNGSDVL